MNIPNTVSETPKEKIFRLKGARYCFLYNGFIPKDAYYSWYKNTVITRRMEFDLFIGHITLNGAQFTRVLFRSISQTIDWKCKEKLFFKVGEMIYQPEIRPIYKTSWAGELTNLFQLDPKTYPGLPMHTSSTPAVPAVTPILQARSPKRIKGVSLAVLQTSGTSSMTPSIPSVNPITSIGTKGPLVSDKGPMVQGVKRPLVSDDEVVKDEVPALCAKGTAFPDDEGVKVSNEVCPDSANTFLELVNKIMNRLDTLEERIGTLSLNEMKYSKCPKDFVSDDEVVKQPENAVPFVGVYDAKNEVPVIPELVPKIPESVSKNESEILIYMEGDASDIITVRPDDIILENKSVIFISTKKIDGKQPIFSAIGADSHRLFSASSETKSSPGQSIDNIISTLNKNNIWFSAICADSGAVKCPPGIDDRVVNGLNFVENSTSASLIIKNTDLMVLQALI